jgi:hypothetical protein
VHGAQEWKKWKRQQFVKDLVEDVPQAPAKSFFGMEWMTTHVEPVEALAGTPDEALC